MNLARTYFFFLGSVATLLGLANVSYAKNIFYPVDGFTLKLQLTPAVCAMQPKRSNLKQCKNGMPISALALKPESKSKPISKNYAFTIPRKHIKNIGLQNCSKQAARLSPLQSKVVSKWMPDQAVRNYSWQKFGSCTQINSTHYFRLIGNFSEKLNFPQQMLSGRGFAINTKDFKQKILNKNKALKSSHINLLCKKLNNSNSVVLTELQVCYDTSGKYSDCIAPKKSNCPKRIKILGLP